MFKHLTKTSAYGVYFNSVRMLIGASSALFLMEKGLSLQGIATLKAFQAFILIVSDIPLGYIADKVSKKLSVILAVAFGALWLLTTAWAPSIEWLFVGEAFNALSLGFFGGAFSAILIEDEKAKGNNQVNKILGEYGHLQFLAMAVCALIGGLFTEWMTELWLVSGGLLLLQLVFMSSFLPSHKGTKSPRKSILIEFKNDFLKVKNSYTPGLLVVVLGHTITFIFYQIIIQYWQPIVKGVPWIQNHIFLLGPLFAVILLVQSYAGKYISKIKNTKSMFITANAITATVSLGLIYCLDQGLSLLLLVIMFFLLRCTLVLGSSIFNEAIEDELRATLASFNSTFSRVVLVILFPIFGALINDQGLEVVGFLGVVASLFATVLALVYSKNSNLKT